MNNYLIFIIIIIIIIIIIYSIIYYNYENIQVWIMNRIIVQRGILSTNYFWYKISDIFLSDSAGIDLYNNFKQKYGDFEQT